MLGSTTRRTLKQGDGATLQEGPLQPLGGGQLDLTLENAKAQGGKNSMSMGCTRGVICCLLLPGLLAYPWLSLYTCIRDESLWTSVSLTHHVSPTIYRHKQCKYQSTSEEIRHRGDIDRGRAWRVCARILHGLNGHVTPGRKQDEVDRYRMKWIDYSWMGKPLEICLA